MQKTLSNADLIIDAYVTDKAIWDRNLKVLKEKIADKHRELMFATVDVETEPFSKKIWFKMIRKPSPNQIKLDLVKKELDDLERKLKVLIKQEPNAHLYEFAMLGGSVFKAV